MDVKVGLAFLFLLAGSYVCSARTLTPQGFSDEEINASGSIDLCSMCEEYTTMALDYLNDHKTQEEVMEALHRACSEMHGLKEQCTRLVDFYAPLFFSQVSSVQPEGFCKKAGLCRNGGMLSLPRKTNKCDLCQLAMNDVLDKLKDPDTKLGIIEVLLKTCNIVDKYAKKCKSMVFEFGPLILTDAEKFIEKVDICSTFHACPRKKVDAEGGLADGEIEMVVSS